MISKLLVKTFVNNSENVKDKNVRSSYGLLGGIIGIIVNIILFIIKLTTGLIMGSIAVVADAFNNLSDAASSVITIVGFKIANIPADEKHPFGHGRIEYISALVVSFMVMIVGIQFVKSSFERILNPEAIEFKIIPFILLLVSICLKLWLSKFNKYIGDAINSSALKAASADSLGDVFTSSCVAVSLLASRFTTIPIDGYIGILVALFIVYSGITLIKETIDPLLGEAPDPELVQDIKDMLLSYENVTGLHDLVIHNYGPGRCMASVHAEIPSNIDVMTIHNIIDKAERDISEALNIYLVIHMDPICISSGEVRIAYEEVKKIVDYNPLIKSMHDFRLVGEGDEKNLIFDIVVNSNFLKLVMSEDELKASIEKEIKKLHPLYNCIITIDHEYV